MISANPVPITVNPISKMDIGVENETELWPLPLYFRWWPLSARPLLATLLTVWVSFQVYSFPEFVSV